MGMSKDTGRRGLRSLEAAGLVGVEIRPGRALQVTVLKAPVVVNNDQDAGLASALVGTMHRVGVKPHIAGRRRQA
jgi:hypothetical protein